MEQTRRAYVYKDADSALSRFVTGTWGVDTSWQADGSCKHHPLAVEATEARPQLPTPWTFSTIEKSRRGTTKRQLQEDRQARHALAVCAGCTVQYDCASFAVQTEQQACIWGLSSHNLTWLLRRTAKQGVAIIDAGRRSGQPVEVYVRGRRLGISSAP